MELAIGIIIGIAAGVIVFWIFNRKQKAELDSLRKAKTDLTVERDNAQKDKVDLENRLGEANVQIGDLKNEAKEKTEQINNLKSEAKEKATRINNLESEVAKKATRINNLESEVAKKATRISNLESEVAKKATRISNLESEVAKKATRISNLESEVAKKATRISNLESEVAKKATRINNLTDRLKAVSASNEKALQVLYLFELSLQLTAFALYSEVSRAKHLGGENKKLYAEYKKLYAEYGKNVDKYKKLCKEIKRKTKGRLARSGVGAVLSLFPGAGLLQVVGDIVDLVDFIKDVAEGTTDFYDVISAAGSSVGFVDFLVDFIELKSIESLQPEISSDQEREKVRQKYQSIFKKVFEQNLVKGNEEPNASDFYKFLKAIIQRMKEFVDSMPENERQNALNRLVGNFGEFGITLYRDHKSSETYTDRSLPAPEN